VSDDEFDNVLESGTEKERAVLLMSLMGMLLNKVERLEERVRELEARDDEWDD
jgi:hypothetical protein